jgi:hypothetical protein
VAGILLKNNSVKYCLLLFVVSAFCCIEYGYRGGEEWSKTCPTLDTKLFTHEELAEKLALVLYLLGIVSIEAFF